MRTKNKLVFYIAILSCLNAVAQLHTYDKKMQLNGVSELWHSIQLPDDVFESVKDDMADIRIYGITQSDTLEVPYILKYSAASEIEAEANFKLINTTSTNDGYYYTYEFPISTSLNQIAFSFGNTNFDWKANLEGSQDQTKWFTILEDYRILSIRNQQTDYSFTQLDFPDSKYQYFRLFIKTKDKPELLRTSLISNESIPATYTDYPVKNINVSEKGKETYIDIDLKQRAPVSYLKLDIADTIDYYRNISFQYVFDSVKTEKGWIYNYKNLGYAMLTSIEDSEFTLRSTLAKKLRAKIKNYDNQPLKINTVTVKGYQYYLNARFTEQAQYYLAYGKKQALRPVYDITEQTFAIPENISALTLGQEEIIPKKEIVTNAPLFENKWWLWGIMIVIILLLGGFTLKMIQKKA
ncbi:DUF3999 family protein [Costertonia aggregata]|uniref:DUF3999 family protein n=1 Tax=Costertonia aggregata TaxID=343403 RepID=A0A7H9AL36_9FLAO|nr:DUF3999 family protein [Costertonia aggregata]QLG44176.1 DUF3999 family protein [Costertonia aggregata]